MSMLVWLFVVLAVIIALLLIRKYSSVEFVAHATLLFRTWSVWLTSTGAVVGVYLASAPDAIISAWNMLPPDLKALFPVNIAQYVSYFLIALGVISQFVRQRKLSDKRHELDGQP